MRVSFRLITAVTLLAAAQLPLGAQTRANWSVQGSGLIAGLGGDAYRGVDTGYGLELQARKRLTAFWSLGCGLSGTYHEFSEFQGEIRLEGAFCEPRRVIDVGSESVFPYLSARGAFLYRNDTDSTGFNASANGITANIGAGIMVPFGSKTSNYPMLVEFGGSAGYTTFGDLNGVLRNGNTFTRDGGSGFNFVLRAGIAIGLPFGNNP